MLYSLKHFDESEVAKQRMKIIRFYETYGEKATKEAFGADRKVISRWKKRLTETGGKLESLIPFSTRPKRVRMPRIHWKVVAYIRSLRETYPRIGKEKIKPLVDEYCEKEGLQTISVSTIGNTIKRHHLFFHTTQKVYHDPSSGWAQRRHREKRTKVKHSPKPTEFGYVISDTIERVTDGIKDYFYNALEIKSRFALTLHYKRLSSKNMEEFSLQFQKIYPGQIHTWQTDNGSENLGDFHTYLKKDGILHVFSYPRCPRINAYIERYNRTVQEEFIDHHIRLLPDEKLFNTKLAEYLIFYNTKRVHKGLGNKSTPVQYLIDEGVLSQMCLTYTIP